MPHYTPPVATPGSAKTQSLPKMKIPSKTYFSPGTITTRAGDTFSARLYIGPRGALRYAEADTCFVPQVGPQWEPGDIIPLAQIRDFEAEYVMARTKKPAFRDGEMNGRLLRAWDITQAGEPVASIYELRRPNGEVQLFREDAGTKDRVHSTALSDPFYDAAQ
jgi:hypothetical protein